MFFLSGIQVGTIRAPFPCMIFFVLGRIFSLVLDLVALARRSEDEKDVEILLLRHQLHILQRKRAASPRISRWEKLTLVILTGKLTAMTTSARARLGQVVLLFKPETVLKWHRELVRRKWTFKQRAPRGRPPTSRELEGLILRLAHENPRWGYGKLEGELGKLGYDIGRSTIRDVLKRKGVPPAPERAKRGSSWRSFLKHHKGEVLACDFFTVVTAWLKTLYVLFFIELGSRRVHLAGCTVSPTSAWVVQQARQMSWTLQEEALPMRFLLHDRDAKFPAAFDHVFEAENVTIIRTPFRVPTANAFAERRVRSAREECLDHVLISGERHLNQVLTEYVSYFNYARPHQGIAQQIPTGDKRRIGDGPVRCRDVLGGVIHDYYRLAA